jgi:hypothetical protein
MLRVSSSDYPMDPVERPLPIAVTAPARGRRQKVGAGDTAAE